MTKRGKPSMAAFAPPVSAPAPTIAAPPPSPAGTDSPRVNFPFRMTEAQRTALKVFALHQGKTVQEILETAVNDLFTARSQPAPFPRQ